MKINKSALAALYMCIFQRIYVARNITCNEETILDCLKDIDSICNADNDHNGEYSLYEINKQYRRVITKMMKKYGFQND